MKSFPIYICFDNESNNNPNNNYNNNNNNNNNGGYKKTFWCSMCRIGFPSLEALWAYRAALVVYLLQLTGIFGSNYHLDYYADKGNRRCQCCENCNHVIPAAEDYDEDEYAEDGDDEDDDDSDDGVDDDDDDDVVGGDMEVDDHVDDEVDDEDVIDVDSDGEAGSETMDLLRETGPIYQSAPAPAPAVDPMEEEKSDVDLELRLWFTK